MQNVWNHQPVILYVILNAFCWPERCLWFQVPLNNVKAIARIGSAILNFLLKSIASLIYIYIYYCYYYHYYYYYYCIVIHLFNICNKWPQQQCDEQSPEEHEYQYVEVTNIQMHTKPQGQYKKWKIVEVFWHFYRRCKSSLYVSISSLVWTLLLDLAKSGASLLAMLDSWQLHSGTNIYQYEPCFANAIWCNLQHSIKKRRGLCS